MRPRDLAERMLSLSMETATFTLPVAEARSKARDIINCGSRNGFVPIVENWRQRPDGNIEFTVRNFRAQ